MGDRAESRPTAALPPSIRVPASGRGAEGGERQDREAPGSPTRSHQPSDHPPTSEGRSSGEGGPGQLSPWQPTKSEHNIIYWRDMCLFDTTLFCNYNYHSIASTFI